MQPAKGAWILTMRRAGLSQMLEDLPRFTTVQCESAVLRIDGLHLKFIMQSDNGICWKMSFTICSDVTLCVEIEGQCSVCTKKFHHKVMDHPIDWLVCDTHNAAMEMDDLNFDPEEDVPECPYCHEKMGWDYIAGEEPRGGFYCNCKGALAAARKCPNCGEQRQMRDGRYVCRHGCEEDDPDDD